MEGRNVHKLSVLIVCILVLSHTMELVACEPLSEEGLALLAMKSSFTDPQNHLENWKLNGIATPCLWTGITCSNASSVVGLNLSNMNLTGTLPADLGRLKNLVNLSLDLNNFTGVLPAEIVTLLMLQYVNISNNRFNGAFPANVSRLQSLKV